MASSPYNLTMLDHNSPISQQVSWEQWHQRVIQQYGGMVNPAPSAKVKCAYCGTSGRIKQRCPNCGAHR